MKPGFAVAAVFVLSLLLISANQVFLGSPIPTALYALAVCSLFFFAARDEKKKRAHFTGDMLLNRVNMAAKKFTGYQIDGMEEKK